MAPLTADQLDDLQAFLKDWLRHTGRTQSDLRRALQAGSIRMPVLLEVLQRTYDAEGLTGLAHKLCGIEERWQREDTVQQEQDLPDNGGTDGGLGQLDLLLQEIRESSSPSVDLG